MKFDDAYILSYIERKLPVDDLRECDALMNSSPGFREKVERIETIYELSENLRKQKKIDTEKAWTRLSRKIAFASFRAKAWNIGRTAAAVLLPLFLLHLFLLHQFVIQPMLKTTPSEMITLSSAPGIVTKAVLPDGSEVWLNAQSELTYPVQFTGPKSLK